MCQALPPPPDDVDAIPPPPSEDLTKREQLAIHSADPSCAACHALMDPLGLAFESYDSIGRFRLEENGKSLDLAGELDPGSGVLFDDSIELSRLLAEGETTQRCFVDTMLEYSVGHALDDGDRCAVDALGQGFIDGDGDVIGLITNIVTAERFVHRAGP